MLGYYDRAVRVEKRRWYITLCVSVCEMLYRTKGREELAGSLLSGGYTSSREPLAGLARARVPLKARVPISSVVCMGHKLHLAAALQ